MKTVIMIIGKELDAEQNHGCVGVFKSMHECIQAIRKWVNDHKEEFDEVDDFLDGFPEAFVRIKDEYANVFELWPKEIVTKSLDDTLSYG